MLKLVGDGTQFARNAASSAARILISVAERSAGGSDDRKRRTFSRVVADSVADGIGVVVFSKTRVFNDGAGGAGPAARNAVVLLPAARIK